MLPYHLFSFLAEYVVVLGHCLVFLLVLSSEKAEASDFHLTQCWEHSRHILWFSEINKLYRGVAGAAHVPFTSGPCCFLCIGLYTTSPRMAMAWVPWAKILETASVSHISSLILLTGSEDEWQK